MNPIDYKLFDLHRILLGTSPAEFLFESLLRTMLMYPFLLLVLRCLGKRMNSQATIAELAVMLMLGAIIAMPIESADRGVVPGMLLLLVVLLLQRGSAIYGYSDGSAPKVLGSGVTALILDGQLQLNVLAKELVSREQLFSILRQEDIVNLGQVERLYFESNGGFSLFKTSQPKPGLCTFPAPEAKILFGSKLTEDWKACRICGATIRNQALTHCACGADSWAEAIL